MSLPTLLNSANPTTSSAIPRPSLSHAYSRTHKLSWSKTLQFPAKPYALSPSFQSNYLPQDDDVVELRDDSDSVIGDCLVFEEGVFEDPYLQNDSSYEKKSGSSKTKRKKKRNSVEIEAEDLIPEKWKQVQEEINMTKKEKRKIAQQIQFGSRVEKKRQGYLPIKNLDLKDYLAYKEAKLSQLRPVLLHNPSLFREVEDDKEDGTDVNVSPSKRLAPKNPKWAVYGRGLDDVAEFFNSGQYEPPPKKSEGNAFSYLSFKFFFPFRLSLKQLSNELLVSVC